jgi:hypothetical protein
MKTISEVYTPLLDEFIKKLAQFPASDYLGIPHPFLPEIGRKYRLAVKRIAIVGKETRGWKPNLDEFIPAYLSGGFDFSKEVKEFQNLNFKDSRWMGGRPTRSSLWGFWMNVLAKLYGISDWNEIRCGNYDILLDSFAWGNANAIETQTSKGVNPNAPGYLRAKALSEKLFDSVDLLIKAANPHVLILTCSISERDRYLGPRAQLVERVEDRVSVFKRGNLLVLYAPHPRNQNMHTGGADTFARIMRDLLAKYKMFCPLPDVLKAGLKPEAQQILVQECMGIPKFEAIAKVACELRRQHSCMTARSLCLDILNPAGHKSNRGEPFTGNVWGPCRLVSTAWNYYQNVRKMPDVAENIALSFTNLNGDYAYE